ncbi:hypothetical protein LguiA_010369 [Lonicera macranthoides]
MLALAAQCGWTMHQMDVKNAFLHGDLQEEDYMAQPGEFINPTHSYLVCKLNKSLYGLKQAPRAWNDKFTQFLPTLGFVASHADPSLFIKSCSSNSWVYLLLYVDDIILSGSSESAIQSVKDALQQQFDMKDLGKLHYFLGSEINYTPLGLLINQQKYAKEVIHKHGMEDCNSAITPCQSGLKLLKEGVLLSDTEVSNFRSLVGCLQYLTFTRPDIAFAVNSVCQFMHQPTDQHYNAAKRILRYIQGTLDYGLLYTPNPTKSLTVSLKTYTDADWAGDPNDRRSTTGFVLMINGLPISWCSKKQKSVSRSSTEAEYRSMADTTSEIQWLQSLLSDMHIQLSTVPSLHCDNIFAMALATNPIHNSRLKHIEADIHFTRERVKAGALLLQFVPSSQQLADIFTKGLCSPQHNYLCSSLMLVTKHQAEGEYLV